jgi:hypothetical protein
MRLPIPDASQIVLIGTTRYKGSFGQFPLPAVANNVTDLRTVLTDKQYGGFSAANSTTLINEPDHVKILRAVKTAAMQASDTLLVYIAGHALAKDPSGNELYMFLPNTDDSGDDLWWHHALPYSDIRDLVRNSRAACRMVIVDSCYSGRILPEAMGNGGPMTISGTYTLAAVGRNKHAVAPAGARYTAFSGVLLTLLANGIDDSTPELSLPRIYPHLRATLLANSYPEPHQALTETVEHKAVVRNRASLLVHRIPPQILEMLNSPINTIVVDGIRQLEGLHNTGTRALRQDIREQVLRFLNHDSKVVSQEAHRLYRRTQDRPRQYDTKLPVQGRFGKASRDPWWIAWAVLLTLGSGAVLMLRGFTIGYAAQIAVPIGLVAYVVAVLVALTTHKRLGG